MQQVKPTFTYYNILVSEQFGFRKGLSTDIAACKLTDTVFKSYNQQRHVGETCCNLAKAVTVNYKILPINCIFMVLKKQVPICLDHI
jgi:hypothetical protein